MAERVITPTGQRHFIEPFDQRVFQFDTPSSDVFLSRVANSVYQVLGDDIVMYGLEVKNLAHTSDSIVASVSKGAAIQDQTLIVTPEQTDLEIGSVSGMDESGRIVVLLNYNYLETFEQNKHSILMNYVDSLGNPLHSFLPQRDRIVLGILQFTKDGSDNVTGVVMTPEKFITIDGKQYFVRGFFEENKRLTGYLLHQLISGAGSSFELDPNLGLRLIGDLLAPGNLKFYGTNQVGSKGWYDLSTLSVDNASDIPDFQKQYNMAFFNGNLVFVEEGHDLVQEIYPVWDVFPSDIEWTGEIDAVFNSVDNTWEFSGPSPQLKVADSQNWNFKFRPIKFRINQTFIPDDGSTSISLIDRNGNTIAHSDNYNRSDDLLIDWSNNEDIYRIIFPGATTIGGIEFFGGTRGDLIL